MLISIETKRELPLIQRRAIRSLDLQPKFLQQVSSLPSCTPTKHTGYQIKIEYLPTN